ncbi:hypothetical protein HN803_07205 [candidate division WWE3 bacterium]|jgi:hypothetical protein|nr:hypothetical protein [candidate division WWE3 bacterium]
MYQKEVDIEFVDLANSVAEWSITRYGYFVNSHVDKLETVKAFAVELMRLPKECLSYVDKAKNKWIDEGHPRPPQMADFLTMLRVFNNEDQNAREKPKQLDSNIDYAGRWDRAKTDEQKLAYMKSTFDQHKTPPATKYWIKQHFKNIWSDKKVQGVVYGRF